MITREQFFAVPKPALREVQVPALGDSVFVRMLTAGDRERFEDVHVKAPRKDLRARLVVACACDSDGAPLFTADDVPALSALPALSLDPIAKAGSKLNQFFDEDVDALEKNS
jgi:hypothetical protein